MADPIGTFSGLSSGIQWRDMVDQIMKIESQRRLDPLTARQTTLTKQADAWKAFQGVVAKFRDAARALRDTASFNLFSATVTKPSASSPDTIAVSPTTSAAPGRYEVEVLATARAEKIGGAVVASGSTALGLAGSFAINGRTVTLVAQDTLATVRDKVNALNAGSSPTGVSASILGAGTGSRLILTAGNTGLAGIELTEGGGGMLSSLGFSDGTTSANLDSAGAAQTYRFSSSTATIATQLGVTLPAATSVRIGGQVIAIDFATDSLASIADKINTASGNPLLARVTSESVNGKTQYRLVTDATVATDAGAVPADSARALAVLGFTVAGRGSVAQNILSANTFNDALTGVAATGAALLTDLQTNGQSLGLSAGDTITIGGQRGDGTSVTKTLVVGAGTTLNDLLATLNDASSGYAAGTRTATAALTGGRISLTDNTAGDSRLSLQLGVSKAGGGSVSLGAVTAANGGTTGISRQITAGSNAIVRVDGQQIERSSNTITDAINGVTITALAAAIGTTTQIDIARNTSGITQVAQDFVKAYNAVRTFVTTNSADNGPLANNTSLRSMSSSFTSRLLTTVVGASSSYSIASMAGMSHDKNGTLSLDASVFKTALESNFDDVRKLFAMDGATTDAELSYVSATDLSQPRATPYDVNITQASTLATVTGASWTTYATAGAPDTMTISDASSGLSGSITIANGETIAAVTQRLNAMFAAQQLRLQATRTVDNRLQITSLDYGTTGGFTVAYTPGAGGDGTAALGVAAQAYSGLDVAGTINGIAGTGKGQILTGAAGALNDPAQGIAVRYTGSTARAVGTVAFVLGVGGALERDARALTTDATGTIPTQEDNARTRADGFDLKLANIQARLDQRRAALIKQFVAMESALSKAQSIGSALAAQINSFSGNR